MPPAVKTSKQISQTRTGFCKLNFRIEISFSKHFLHKTRPQWRQWCLRFVMENFDLPFKIVNELIKWLK